MSGGARDKNLDRLVFFSDAVFAIVLTLLVLELRAPEVEPGDEAGVAAALRGIGGHFAAFIFTFALVGLWWIVHLRVTRRMIAFDWPAAIVNLIFLASITLMPFASALFGANFTSAIAIEIYWLVNAAASATMTLLFVVIHRDKGRLVGGLARGEWMFRFLQSIAPGIAFLIGAWAAANGYVWLSRFCWVLMFPITLIGRLFYRPTRAPPAASGSA